MRKKFGALCAVLVLGIVVAALCGAGTYDFAYKAVTAANLYQSDSLTSEVLITIPQNAMAEPLEEPFLKGEVEWQKVKYLTFTGYALSGNFYKSSKNESYEIKMVKARSSKMGQKIPLFATHIGGEPTHEVNDGEIMRLIQTDIEYGDFCLVEYSGSSYFAVKKNITTGLSYNQTIAVIIACCFVVVIVASCIAVAALRKKRISRASEEKQ